MAASVSVENLNPKVLRWALGSVEIFFSNRCPLWYGYGGGLKILERFKFMQLGSQDVTKQHMLVTKIEVGYSYESPEQNEPIFDATGIETVWRDTCPAVAKILERSLRIMFEEQDLAKVRLGCI